MPTFSSSLINLYPSDIPRAALLFGARVRRDVSHAGVGRPVHIQLKLDGFSLGIATIEAVRKHHGLRPEGEGRWIEIVLWTDDSDTAVNAFFVMGGDSSITEPSRPTRGRSACEASVNQQRRAKIALAPGRDCFRLHA